METVTGRCLSPTALPLNLIRSLERARALAREQRSALETHGAAWSVPLGLGSCFPYH